MQEVQTIHDPVGLKNISCRGGLKYSIQEVPTIFHTSGFSNIRCRLILTISLSNIIRCAVLTIFHQAFQTIFYADWSNTIQYRWLRQYSMQSVQTIFCPCASSNIQCRVVPSIPARIRVEYFILSCIIKFLVFRKVTLSANESLYQLTLQQDLY